MNGWYDTLVEFASFVLVAGVAFPVLREVERRFVLRERLNQGGVVVTTTPVLRDHRVRSGFLNWVQARTSLSDPAERERLRAELSQAGYVNPAAPMIFVTVRYGLALGLPLLWLSAVSFANPSSSTLLTVTVPLGLCVIGLFLPRFLLRRAIAIRRTTIEQQFPDALDLMVICVDAGGSLESAIQRVTREMRRSHREIAGEFERVSEELSAGRSRSDALHNLARRLEVPSIRGFVSLVVQSQTLGASVSQALKTYSIEMRHRRAMIAEEKAMRIPVLISIPLVVCFLPVIVVATLLPATIDIIRVVGPSLRGAH
jgi:tight adherence protein C